MLRPWSFRVAHSPAPILGAGLLLLAACGGEGGGPPAEAPAGAPAAAEGTVEAPLTTAHDAFFDNLRAYCGRSFRGRAELATSDAFDGEMIMHVRVCRDDEIQIPLHVGENRSRTWILTRTAEGIRLKHDHRYPGGTEEAQTQYGGDTVDEGSPLHQAFPADAFTAELIPEAATNVWNLTLDPEARRLTYHLTRHDAPRATFVFDLSDEVAPPPPAWGYEGTEPTHGADGRPRAERQARARDLASMVQ